MSTFWLCRNILHSLLHSQGSYYQMVNEWEWESCTCDTALSMCVTHFHFHVFVFYALDYINTKVYKRLRTFSFSSSKLVLGMYNLWDGKQYLKVCILNQSFLCKLTHICYHHKTNKKWSRQNKSYCHNQNGSGILMGTVLTDTTHLNTTTGQYHPPCQTKSPTRTIDYLAIQKCWVRTPEASVTC